MWFTFRLQKNQKITNYIELPQMVSETGKQSVENSK